jgi:hypothetical protein
MRAKQNGQKIPVDGEWKVNMIETTKKCTQTKHRQHGKKREKEIENRDQRYAKKCRRESRERNSDRKTRRENEKRNSPTDESNKNIHSKTIFQRLLDCNVARSP